MIAKDIITKARFTLGDLEGDRWSDTRLLDLLDEAQKDICLTTHLYRRVDYIPMVVGQYEYDLPEDAIMTHRVQTLDAKVPFTTKDDMDDKVGSTWRADVGNQVTHVLHDTISLGKLEVYPTPNDEMFYIPIYKGIELPGFIDFTLLDAEGVMSEMELQGQGTAFNTVLGVYTGALIDIDLQINPDGDGLEETIWGSIVDYYTYIEGQPIDVGSEKIDWANNPLGVTAEIDLPTHSQADSGVFGVMTDIDPAVGYLSDIWGAVTTIVSGETVLKVDYSAYPPSIGAINSPLVLQGIWETALKYYVVGYALMDDNDAGNLARGDAMLKRYIIENQKAMKLSALNKNTAPDARVTPYQTGFRR